MSQAETLAAEIMDVRSKADRAETHQEYEHFMEKYTFLKKRWQAVAGNAVIGIEIDSKRKCSRCGRSMRGTNDDFKHHYRLFHREAMAA